MSSSSSTSTSTSTTTLYMYYEGIAMAAASQGAVDLFHTMEKVGKNQVINARKQGEAQAKTLGDDIKKEMDAYAKILKELSPNQHPTFNHFQAMINELPHIQNKSMNYFFGLWVSNVASLLELGIIKNDENNGPMKMTEL